MKATRSSFHRETSRTGDLPRAQWRVRPVPGLVFAVGWRLLRRRDTQSDVLLPVIGDRMIEQAVREATDLVSALPWTGRDRRADIISAGTEVVDALFCLFRAAVTATGRRVAGQGDIRLHAVREWGTIAHREPWACTEQGTG